ncbi:MULTISPECIES: SDR family NAD(P)-dependent oxidoreductase [Streptomyces]|uniref:SDR family NAD(P)-dependent oxidoreductase n=1 Tax=Streptomyces rhizosphaericus TaxID=114699 RepID=A0A6G4A793_9ACTN|nr:MULTISPECIES: SDR family NAD(P)-dependent oxidoreductase [Streptomyces]NEW69266.1 SDR family NAD(P)-dependent oxidoreductase [Streptomyces rhizosphaericus]TMU98141.1 SDR family NAD(P)-dependent oxidoreductase [Streptomyces sp. DASNCL29]
MTEPPVPQTLAGHVAIVTGAGQGIGRAEALALSARGASVVVNDLIEERAQEVADTIVGAGGRAVADTSNVGEPAGGEAITAAAVEAFGTVDIVVNNAGFLRPGWFEDLTVDDIDSILDVHLRAAFYVTQPAWRIMKAKRYGRVVMTGSSAGMFSQAANSNYCAAKAGVFGLARALSQEGAEFGINVNVVLPFAATMISKNNPIPGNQEARERRGAAYRGEIQNRRDPELVAPLVVFLAEPDCDTNGDVFSACAGRYARVFAALGQGWLSPRAEGVTVEDLRDNWAAVCSANAISEPRTLFDEVAEVVRVLDA